MAHVDVVITAVERRKWVLAIAPVISRFSLRFACWLVNRFWYFEFEYGGKTSVVRPEMSVEDHAEA